MKQRKTFSQGIIIVLIAALALSGCAAQPTATNTPTPSTQEATTPIINASGEVVPAQWTTLSFAQAGNIAEVLVKEGDTVKAGDLLARLDAPDLQALLAQKQAAVKSAEANLAQLTAPARAEDIRAAQEAVAAAQARVAEAAAQRDQLYHAVTQADLIQAQTQVYAAQVQKDKLDEAMRSILDKGGFALAAGEPVGNQLKYAELELAAAQQVLNDLQNGPTTDQRRIAEARIGVAAAQVKAAQARLDLLKAGPQAQDVAMAQAKIDQAQAEAAQVAAQLDQTHIVAPFSATVAQVLIDPHQFVGPGVPIVQLADLGSLRVETTNLNENDVARMKVGDSVQVSFDALPAEKVTGKVTRIEPKATEGAGVNFTTIIQLDRIPSNLRWGMTANVEIDTGATAAEANSTAVENSGSPHVNATGKVLPAQKTALSFALPGSIVKLNVDVGAVVKQGDVIAQLDTSVLDTEVAKAQAGLALAQAGLDRIKAGPRPEQVFEAQGTLSATLAAVAQAAANRDQVKKGPLQAEIDQAQAAVQQAYIDMVQARSKRDLAQAASDRGQASQTQRDDAAKLYNIANQSLAAAQARLDKLQAGADANDLRAAQAGVSAASADSNAQQAQLDRLLAGASPEDIAVAEASVAQAQAGLDQAKAARQQADLIAPFAGTISAVLIRDGQYVNAGQPIVSLGDLGKLQIETTDLNEKDIAGVAIGDKVKVTFDALPGVQTAGTVTKISPKSSKTTGVNYTITIDLAQIPEGLRWGMTALVEMAKQ